MMEMLNSGMTALTTSTAPSDALATASLSEASMNVALALPLPTWPAMKPARASS